MPLSLNEIKDRALAFSREWEGAKAERAEAQTFWNEFFNVFGISRRRIAAFEEPVKTLPLGLLDYVSAWYMKAARYVRGDDRIKGLLDGLADMPKPPSARVKIAFVSTNSITQGEQVGVLWSELLRQGVKIHFAHRTFRWSNEARGKAAVHCVIIGFALHDSDHKIIFDYDDIKGEAHALEAKNINPYLVDAHDILLCRRDKPICSVPEMGIGNKPIDGGNYLFMDEEKAAFIADEPSSAKWFRKWLGAVEFINGYNRWVLWLGDCPPNELRNMPKVLQRVEAVKKFRLESKSSPTRKIADSPTRFHVENMPTEQYLVVPEVSSERRQYIPIGFLSQQIVASNKLRILRDANLTHFGVLSSAMHMAWMRYVTGRLKSDYQYSISIVYNNFPWPSVTPAKAGVQTDKELDARLRGHDNKLVTAIEHAAQDVLDARAAHPESSLADLYDPIAMPPDLRRAHQALDKAVDAAYGKKNFTSDAERVAFLFELYHKYTSLLPKPEVPAKRKRRIT